MKPNKPKICAASKRQKEERNWRRDKKRRNYLADV